MCLLRIGGNGTAPGNSLWLWCPACEDTHRITIYTPSGWKWNGDKDAPTIEPSIKITGVQWEKSSSFYNPNHLVEPGKPTVCHSFVRNGMWQFLGDCTHTMAGKTVPMVELPEWLTLDYIG